MDRLAFMVYDQNVYFTLLSDPLLTHGNLGAQNLESYPQKLPDPVRATPSQHAPTLLNRAAVYTVLGGAFS